MGIDYPIKNSTHTFEDNKGVFDKPSDLSVLENIYEQNKQICNYREQTEGYGWEG